MRGKSAFWLVPVTQSRSCLRAPGPGFPVGVLLVAPAPADDIFRAKSQEARLRLDLSIASPRGAGTRLRQHLPARFVGCWLHCAFHPLLILNKDPIFVRGLYGPWTAPAFQAWMLLARPNPVITGLARSRLHAFKLGNPVSHPRLVLRQREIFDRGFIQRLGAVKVFQVQVISDPPMLPLTSLACGFPHLAGRLSSPIPGCSCGKRFVFSRGVT